MKLWKATKKEFTFPSLTKEETYDTLIIGGGITGILSLYLLRNQSSIALVEAGEIGQQITSGSTAKLTYLQGDIYHRLKKRAGFYLFSQKKAIEKIKNIIEKEQIACDFKQAPSYLFTTNPKEISKIKEEKTFLEKHHIKVTEEIPEENLPILYSIKTEDTYVFHPLKFLYGLLEKIKHLPIYEHTKIISITSEKNGYLCKTEQGNIHAKKVIFACHYPFFLLPFLLPLKTHLEKSYLMAIKVNEKKESSGISYQTPMLSYRYHHDQENHYKIILSGSHNLSFVKDEKQEFENLARLFSVSKQDICFKWTNVDLITDDFLPYIGELKKNLYLSTGYNTWGMTNSMIGAMILSNLILGRKDYYSSFFSPYRKLSTEKLLSFPYHLFSNSVGFIESKLKKNKPWYHEVTFTRENGQSIGVYTDEEGKEHKVYNTCPHMKCSLVFNQLEKTWECPCHSSKFTIDGKCIKGLSKYDITYHEK